MKILKITKEITLLSYKTLRLWWPCEPPSMGGAAFYLSCGAVVARKVG